MSLTLKAVDLWKGYNGNGVLRGCSFTSSGKGIYVLTGPNGSGKSTFLRICALLEEPDRGEVLYFSENGPLNKDMELKRKITLVLPRVGIFNTTVFNNLSYGLKVRGIAKDEMERRVGRYLEMFGLLHRKKQNALSLSSGETQRLGIARAMVTEPEILFLDEPTASVDLENALMIERLILDMKRQGRPTVFMTTHDNDQARRLADNLLQIENGLIYS